jgi:selenide,water dikinase
MGLVPGGSHSNRSFYEPFVEYREAVSDELRDIFYDPQTSGGLLFSVAENKKDGLLKAFKKKKVDAFVVGRVEDKPKGRIIIE